MNYRFITKLTTSSKEDKPYLREGKTKTGKLYKSINLIAKNNNQTCFLECFGMEQDVIKTMNTDNKKIEISVKDKDDPKVLATVANYKKHVCIINGERKEFIYDLDFINYIAEHIDEIKATDVVVTGQVSKNIYNGTISDRFQIQNIYEANDEAKQQMRVTIDEYWTIDDVDASDWKDEKKIYINGYTPAYIDKDTGTKYVSQQVVFDASKINPENEKHVKLMNYKLKMLGLAEEDGKIKNKLKSKKVYKMGLICNYVNGAEEIEFDESQLTDSQKEAIELGLKTLEDFKPKGQIFGNRITQYKVVDFNLNGVYEDGVADADMTPGEFEEEIYVISKPDQKETLDDIMPKPVDTSSDDDSDIEDLFG